MADLSTLPLPSNDPTKPDVWGAALRAVLADLQDGKASAAQGLLSTSGKPNNALGVDGQFALDATAQIIYRRTSGAWDAGRSLLGPQGPAGPTGASGATGSSGAVGAQGVQGPAGPQGPQGPQGVAGSTGLTFKGAFDNSATYAVNDSVAANGQQYFSKVAGNSGHTPPTGSAGDSFWGVLAGAGPAGAAGATGATGAQGPTGAAGAQGVAGKSAYELAVAGGFSGTQAQYLASLVGAQGPQGVQGATGTTGATGAAGASAYAAWLAAGNSGTQAQFLASLVGPQGATGAAGPTGTTGAQGPTGAAGATGPQGTTGATGAAGANGSDGSAVYKTPNAGKTAFTSGTQNVYVGLKADLDATFTATGTAPSATDIVHYTDPIRFANSLRAENMNPGTDVINASSSLTTTSGVAYGAQITVKADGPVDKLVARLGVTGSGLTYAQFGLYTWDMQTLIATTDATATLAAMQGAAGNNSLALSATISQAQGPLRVVLLVVGTTGPKMSGVTGLSAQTAGPAAGKEAPVFSFGTGLTTLPSTVALTGLTAYTAGVPFFGLHDANASA